MLIAARLRSNSTNVTHSARASGLAFVVCFAVAAALYGSGAGSTQASVAAYYARHGDRQIAGFAVLLAGCLCLLAFVVAAAAGDVLALASGVAATLLLAVGNALWATTAFTVELERSYVPTASSHLLLEDAAWIVIVSAAALAIPFVAVVSRASGRPWFCALGAATVLALAAAYWYVPLAVFLLWVALTPRPPATPRA